MAVVSRQLLKDSSQLVKELVVDSITTRPVRSHDE